MTDHRASINLRAIAGRVEAVPRSTVIAAVRASKDVAGREGGTVQLWRKKSRTRRTVRLRAVDDVRDTANGVTARVQGVPVGPWVWKNTGTRRHVVGAGRKARFAGPSTGPRGGALLSFGPNRVRRGPVVHPGTSGAGKWRRVVARTERVAVDAFGDAVREAVR